MKRALIAAAVAAFGLLGAAPVASASFHEVDISEVYAGSAGNPDSDFVELKMWAPGQNLVNFGQLRVYTTADGLTSHTYTPTSSVPNSEDNRTILVGDSQFAAEFGSAADFTTSTLDINPTVGAVCWPVNSTPVDCVSWGAFTGTLPDAGYDNSDAPALTTTQSLTRSFTPYCSTFFEDADDSDVAGDFGLASPTPRRNTESVLETPCTLTVLTNGGIGTGTVGSSPGGISCPGDCTQIYAGAPTVTLTGTPTNGSSISPDSWSPNCTPVPMMANQCTIPMTQSATVVASFDPPANPTVTVALAGAGSGSVSDGAAINCPGTCTDSFSQGDPVTLTATAAAGSVFSGWSGCPNPSGNVCGYGADVNRTITATFSPVSSGGGGSTTPAATTTPPATAVPGAKKKCRKGFKLKKGKCRKKKK